MTSSESLPQSARKVQDFLKNKGFDIAVRELPGSTRTAAEAAASIGCRVGQIAKSLVFQDKKSHEPILIIASGANQVDLKKIETATGLELRKADGKFIKEVVGFAIGGIPPVGHTTHLRTFLDPDLQQYEVIWAAAGTPFSVFPLPAASLEELTQGQWLACAVEG
jgi:prolyl-tRNA editing enzyme YbaK/EbsC (Cys-tRNA(Pro) deacylase)